MEAILDAFGVDVKLLLAQLLNFGILAFVLTKLLYKPMFKVLNERADKAKEIETGAKEIAEARLGMEEWRKEQESEAHQEADAIIKKSNERAQSQRREILEKAEAEALALKTRAKQEIEREKQRVIEETKEELSGVVLLAAERVLERSVTSEDTRRLAKDAVATLNSD